MNLVSDFLNPETDSLLTEILEEVVEVDLLGPLLTIVIVGFERQIRFKVSVLFTL